MKKLFSVALVLCSTMAFAQERPVAPATPPAKPEKVVPKEDLYGNKCELTLIEETNGMTRYEVRSEAGFSELVLFKDKTFSLRRENTQDKNYLSMGKWSKKGKQMIKFVSSKKDFNAFIKNQPEKAKDFTYFTAPKKMVVKKKGMSICK